MYLQLGAESVTVAQKKFARICARGLLRVLMNLLYRRDAVAPQNRKR